jgi:hypothetical protein
MTRRLKGFFGLVAVLVVPVIAAPAAHADMIFRNTTGRTLHFELTCNGTGMDTWSLGPYGWRSIYCNNGSRVAAVRIRTDHYNGMEMVVRSTVFDGGTYVLGFDRGGNVNIWHS